MTYDTVRALCQAPFSYIPVFPFSISKYSFPGGESYRDLTSRLKSVVIDVEQQVIPTLVVSHVSILQCLMAYFRNTEVEKCMSIEVPMHTVIKFTPVRGGGWSESQHTLYDEQSKIIKPIDTVISLSEMSQMTNDDSMSGPVTWDPNIRPNGLKKLVS
jgi:broad specificity phosphatase PhoE